MIIPKISSSLVSAQGSELLWTRSFWENFEMGK